MRNIIIYNQLTQFNCHVPQEGQVSKCGSSGCLLRTDPADKSTVSGRGLGIPQSFSLFLLVVIFSFLPGRSENSCSCKLLNGLPVRLQTLLTHSSHHAFSELSGWLCESTAQFLSLPVSLSLCKSVPQVGFKRLV